MKEIGIYSPETTIAASGSYSLSDDTNVDYLHQCDIIKVSVADTGTVTIEATPRTKGGANATNDDSIATGVAAGYDHYLYAGANDITITEDGGANSVTVNIKAYKS